MASLDISLEDRIKNRRNTDRVGRGQVRARRGRGGQVGSSRGGKMFGAPRRNPLGVNARRSAYSIAKSFRKPKNLPWQSGLIEESLKAAGLSGMDAGSKLYISNLDIGVSNEDIRELFSEIGELVRYAIHFDKNGRPSGSAEVVFARRSDAFQAFKRYNNVQLDGKPMTIEIVGTKAEIPLSARINVVQGANGKKRTVVMASGPSRPRGGYAAANRVSGQRGRGGLNTGRGGGLNTGRGGGLNTGRGGAGRGRGRGGGRGGQQWKKKTEKSADELDKELDSYHAEAMQS